MPFPLAADMALLALTPQPRDILSALQAELGKVILGKPDVIRDLLTALIGGGHILMEDVPGVGKTTLAKALARAFDAEFKRVQFTPDLLPSDILGSSVYSPRDGTFTFKPGPIFANILLADEINRASPRTQSSLLEAMSERQASIEGTTHPLPAPFLVIATQNPIEFHGTYPLPEAALDRFLARAEIGYPEAAHERALYTGRDAEAALTEVRPVMTRSQLIEAQAAVTGVLVREPVADYVLRVVAATREHPSVALGASPRAALAWIRAAKARAWLHGRDYALPDDLKTMAQPVLAHRVFLQTGGNAAGFVDEVLSGVAVPL